MRRLVDITWIQSWDRNDKEISLGIAFKFGCGAEVSVGEKTAFSVTAGPGGGLVFAIKDK
jgi:hypothetical protein